MTKEQIDNLLIEINRLHERNELAETVEPEYFEPGMMEYLDKSDGYYDEETGRLFLRFESRGTRYDGRTEQIERIKVGDEIRIIRDESNPYNHNNFLLFTIKDKDVGCMPAELCNVIAPLYDEGSLVIENAEVTYVEPLSMRNRHAKQAVLFVGVKARVSEKNIKIYNSMNNTVGGQSAI